MLYILFIKGAIPTGINSFSVNARTYDGVMRFLRKVCSKELEVRP